MKVLIFSGAGVSAESGINTYRDKGGIWEKYDQSKVCTLPAAFENREMTFNFFNECLAHFKDARPNAAHMAAAELQKKLGAENVLIFTQNVDTLFEQAGCTQVSHLHGHLNGYLCHCCDIRWPKEPDAEFSLEEACPECKDTSWVKCDAVMFGEAAPEYANLERVRTSLTAEDFIVVVGTSFNVIDPSMIFNEKTFASPRSINVNPDGVNPYDAFGVVHARTAKEYLPFVLDMVSDIFSREEPPPLPKKRAKPKDMSL